jgi:hypothetical protein
VCIEGEEFGDGGVRYGLEVAPLSRDAGAQNGVLVVEGRLGVISRNVVPMRLGNRRGIGGNSVGRVLQDLRRCRMTYKLPSFWFVPIIIGRFKVEKIAVYDFLGVYHGAPRTFASGPWRKTKTTRGLIGGQCQWPKCLKGFSFEL